MLVWNIPLLAEEGAKREPGRAKPQGRLRHQLKVAEPPKAPQTGAKRERDSNEAVIVVSPAKLFRPENFAELTTPAAPFRNGSIFIYGAATPPLRGGE